MSCIQYVYRYAYDYDIGVPLVEYLKKWESSISDLSTKLYKLLLKNAKKYENENVEDENSNKQYKFDDSSSFDSFSIQEELKTIDTRCKCIILTLESEVICGSNYLITKIFPDIQDKLDDRVMIIHQFNTHRRQLAAVKNQQDKDSQLIEELEETIQSDRNDLRDLNNQLYSKFLVISKQHYSYLRTEIGTSIVCFKQLLKELEIFLDTIIKSFSTIKGLESFSTELLRDYNVLLSEKPVDIGITLCDRKAGNNPRAELSFTKGDVILVSEKYDDGWAKGILYGSTGVFPMNCIKLL